MSQSTASPKKNNLVRVRVTIRGTRPLLQHAFGPDAIPLEKGEKTGVAGNDPEEWRRSMMVTADGQLYIRGNYVFSCIREGAKYTKKGRGSIQPLVAATLQIEDPIVLLDRWLPTDSDPQMDQTAGTCGAAVYVDVCGVRNPSTKARNVRYRLAASPGWQCTFIILFDKTLVSRDQMRAVLNDSAVLVGIGDGRSVGNGRFEVIAYEELTDAEEASAEGSVGQPPADRVAPRRKKVQAVQTAGEVDGVPH